MLREPKWYQYVAVSLEGKGRVHWTESHSTGTGDDRRTETRHYSDNETFADLLVIVWGNREAPQPTRIDPGTFTFPFQFTIPPHCPPTFETVTGKIQYRLFGIVSSQVNQYKIETPLVVSSLIDLNLQPNLLQPTNQSTVKNITSCCCINAGEAHVSLKLPRTGFCVIQDRVPVTFECRNGSSRQLIVRAEIAQGIVYNAAGHTRTGSDTIGNYSCQIPPSESDTKSIEFELPSSVSLGFTCRIISVSHSLRLWVTHSMEVGFFVGPAIVIPIVIGNVPLRDTQFVAQPQQQLPNQPGYPPQDPAGAPTSRPIGFTFPTTSPTEPNAVQTTPPDAKLQSQAPPSYNDVISGSNV